MAERANPFTVMKQYLSTMNRRIDEMAARTNSLEEEIRRLPAQESSERSRLSDKLNSDRAELTNQLEGISSQVEQHQNQIMQLVEQLRQQLEETKLSSASKEDLQAVLNTLREEIAPLQEGKLERSEFQEFMEKNNASIKEVFEELTGGQSFADFASSQVTAQLEPIAPESVMQAESVQTIESEPGYSEPLPERRREEKKKKKWL